MKKIFLLFFIFLMILNNCKSSKKNFPWWLLLLGNPSQNIAFDNGGSGGSGTDGGSGGSGSGSGGTNFTPAVGQLDPEFGDNGKKITPIASGNVNDMAYCAAIQNDGKIVLAGTTNNGADFAVVRYNSDGSLDNTFGSNGIVSLDFGKGGEIVYKVFFQSDGKIIAAGTSGGDFAIFRLK